MAHLKARVELLLSVTERLFLCLVVEALQGKICQNSLPSEGVGHLEPRFQGKWSSPCQYIDTTRKAIDCATTLLMTFLYNETLQQTFRPVLSKLSKKRQIQVLYPYFEEVRGSVEPWLMALQGKMCQDWLLSGGGRSVRTQISGAMGRIPGQYFWFLQN